MIGMIILGIIAVMIFFGVTDSYFSKTGVESWVVFLIAVAFAAAYVFPPLITPSGIYFSYAGFFLPLLLGVVTMFALGINGTLLRAVIGALSYAGIIVAARIALPPFGAYSSAVPSIIIAGIAGGISTAIIAQGRLGSVAAISLGVVLGDFVSGMLFRFVTNASGYTLPLGLNGIFDTFMLSLFLCGAIIEASSVIAKAYANRASNRRVKLNRGLQAEAGEDTELSKYANTDKAEDNDGEYDEYFNDEDD